MVQLSLCVYWNEQNGINIVHTCIAHYFTPHGINMSSISKWRGFNVWRDNGAYNVHVYLNACM